MASLIKMEGMIFLLIILNYKELIVIYKRL